MKTQIYSIQTIEEAIGCVEAGVDYIGFAAGTNRNLPAEIRLEKGREIVEAVKGKIGLIALAVGDSSEEIIEMVKGLEPDAVQVCGNNFSATPEFCKDIKKIFPDILVIQAIGVTGPEVIDSAINFSKYCDLLILDSVDTAIAGIGAAGVVNDWSICAEIVEKANCKVILAGGIGPENVATAIEKVRPWCVDSLTKTSIKYPDGTMKKDLKRVKEFVENSHKAAKELGLE